MRSHRFEKASLKSLHRIQESSQKSEPVRYWRVSAYLWSMLFEGKVLTHQLGKGLLERGPPTVSVQKLLGPRPPIGAGGQEQLPPVRVEPLSGSRNSSEELRPTLESAWLGLLQSRTEMRKTSPSLAPELSSSQRLAGPGLPLPTSGWKLCTGAASQRTLCRGDPVFTQQ